MSDRYDVAIVGGGIVGLAHGWAAVRRGLSVVLFERTARACGASVRNFGMVWPIGQPAGEFAETAERSRDYWRELGELGVLPVEDCGSIHLAHRPDELAVLEEFVARGGHDARMLPPDEVTRRAPLANPNGLLAGMWSPGEVRVDPRTALERITGWLVERHNVTTRFETPIVEVGDGRLRSSDGRTWEAERVVVAGGADLRSLFPEVLAASPLRPCKLQMLRSFPLPRPAEGVPHLASGLTLRHYTSFEGCPSLPALRARVAAETPELDRFGIHVMASQFPGGEVVLGDSHEYGEAITPFDKSKIDDLILREAARVFRMDGWRTAERWHGVYAKNPDGPVFEANPADGVHVVTGTGGAGMTMSFGLAERAWQRWTGETT